jgi:hypothetical protein
MSTQVFSVAGAAERAVAHGGQVRPSARAMMSWRTSSRLLSAIGCAWLGAPIVVRMWSPMQSQQQLTATPLYALFAVL